MLRAGALVPIFWTAVLLFVPYALLLVQSFWRLENGTLEPGFRRATREGAERLQRAGLPCRHTEWIGGHDSLWWEQQLPVALGWLLSSS